MKRLILAVLLALCLLAQPVLAAEVSSVGWTFGGGTGGFSATLVTMNVMYADDTFAFVPIKGGVVWDGSEWVQHTDWTPTAYGYQWLPTEAAKHWAEIAYGVPALAWGGFDTGGRAFFNRASQLGLETAKNVSGDVPQVGDLIVYSKSTDMAYAPVGIVFRTYIAGPVYYAEVFIQGVGSSYWSQVDYRDRSAYSRSYPAGKLCASSYIVGVVKAPFN